MRDGKRAAFSAATFAGFLLVAWLQVVVTLLVVAVVLTALPGAAAIRVAFPLVIATAGLLWWATIRALRLPFGDTSTLCRANAMAASAA